MDLPDALVATLAFTRVLDDLGVPYLVAGRLPAPTTASPARPPTAISWPR
jgi:hypothetical protein